MLAVSPPRNSTPAETVGDADGEFSGDFDIDFAELLAGLDDADVLPDLEIDQSEIFLSDFAAAGGEENCPVEANGGGGIQQEAPVAPAESEEKVPSDEEILSDSMREEPLASEVISSSPEGGGKGRKPAAAKAKGSQGKRKVDWTPELHRRFVEAVELLGVDKAVPSRILELMGINCLTRHNVASHLQKYRSHRKHMMAREVEAASWSQRRHKYAAVAAAAEAAGGYDGGLTVLKREMSSWLAPTMGFPPPHHHLHGMQHFRPLLHVWGHPTMIDQSLVHTWPMQLLPPRPPPLPPHGSPWHAHSTTTFPAPPVPGIPSQPMYRPAGAVPAAAPPPLSKQAVSLSNVDAHPSKESIDAAIGDALAQPCLPLPLGLKPPSLESVMVELQNQGISNVPPCT